MNCRLLFLPLLMLASLAVAQEPTDTQRQEAVRTGKPALPYIAVTLAFPGGTLGEFVGQIRAAEPVANIVLAPAAAAARLPAIDLRGAGLDQALESACAVAQSDVLIRVKDFRGPGQAVYTITATEPTIAVASGRPGPSGPSGPSGPVTTMLAGARRETTEVHSLNRLLDPKDGTGFAATTVLSAIEAAVGVDGQLAALRFHKESGLLIFRGTAEQVSTVRDVLGSLERDVQDRRKAMAPRPAATEPAKSDK
jgi:hypothetical protein